MMLGRILGGGTVGLRERWRAVLVECAIDVSGMQDSSPVAEQPQGDYDYDYDYDFDFDFVIVGSGAGAVRGCPYGQRHGRISSQLRKNRQIRRFDCAVRRSALGAEQRPREAGGVRASSGRFRPSGICQDFQAVSDPMPVD
jgi:hypothetical protein